MVQLMWQSLLTGSIISGVFLVVARAAIADPIPANQVPDAAIANRLTDSPESLISPSSGMAQVTSVSQLTDVKPTDWAFQALQSLVERYGCIVGYPDKTYRGNRALTRYEFAAGLNACLDKIQDLLAAATADFVKKDDLEVVKKLQEEFTAELATLRGRVDGLEVRTATLEKQQFSTTTKLNTELIFSVVQPYIDERAVPSPNNPTQDTDIQTTLTYRLWQYWDTSFSGKDRLRIRLQARNTPNYGNSTGTNMTRVAYEGDSGGAFQLSRLEYRFPFDRNRGVVFVEAFGGEFNDNMEVFNPFLASSGKGSISRFGRFNPIYRLSGSAGATLTYKLVDTASTKIALNAGYLVNNANLPVDPNGFDQAGLFKGPFGALAQLDLQFANNWKLGLTYVYSDNVDLSGGTGSVYGSNPFLGILARNTTATANSFGLQVTYRVLPKFTVSGWAGYTLAEAASGPSKGAEAEILNWAATFAFPDLWRRGDVLGFVFGMPPKVLNNDVAAREDRNTSYHLEGFYRLQITDNIAITPGVVVIFNPEHNHNNDTAILGVIRTTFTY